MIIRCQIQFSFGIPNGSLPQFGNKNRGFVLVFLAIPYRQQHPTPKNSSRRHMKRFLSDPKPIPFALIIHFI